MNPGALRHEVYRTGGHAEPIVARGPAGAPQILIVPPLFGEMNRTRRLLADVMRGLSARGLGSWLPDLPGTGESLTPLDGLGWTDWAEAVRQAAAVAAAAGPLVTASIRGGALLDDVPDAIARWRLAPAAGASLLRDLLRVRQMADAEEGARPALAELEAGLASGVVELAGYRLAPALSAGLRAAVPGAPTPLRTVMLGDGPGTADGQIVGPPLWRRAEPGASPELAEKIAEDIASWTATCAIV